MVANFLVLAAATALAAPQPIDPSTWITSADYPQEARRNGQAGVVGYKVEIDAQGAVTACQVTLSSGASSIDSATCNLVRQRARFIAPRDATGSPVASSWSGKVRWTMPQPPPPLAPLAPPIAGGGLNGRGLGAGASFAFPNPWRQQTLLPQFVPRRRPFWPLVPIIREVPPVDVAENQTPPADPAIRFGRLANGLRYAIMPKPTGVGGVSIRMQIAAGSLDETDRQRGYAHLIEHMIFRGSKNVPDGQFAKSLEPLGLTLGRDTNAFTTQETTLFALDFPHAAVAPTKTGVTLLREAAARATIAPAALSAERGVVLAERRLRDDPAQRATDDRLGFLLAGQPIPAHTPIGTLDSITHATSAGLRAFYQAHYRPENVLLVIVGNVDATQVEGEIRDSFGDWTGQGNPPAPVDQGHVRLRFEQLQMFVEPGAPSVAEADWVADYHREADTLASERRIVSENLVAGILNARFARLGEDVATPFVGASLQSGPLFHSAMITTLSTTPKPGQTAAALAAALVEKRRLLRYGVTRQEFDRAVSQTRAGLARMVERATSPDVIGLANELLYSLNYDRVLTTAAQSAADINKILSTLTPADIDAVAERMFGGSGPLIYVSAASAPQGGEAGLRAAIAAADRSEPSAPAVTTTQAWPYTQFGATGRVTDRQTIADLGVTLVRFANGTSITIKSIPQIRDQIDVNLNFGHGLAGLPPGLEQSYWQITSPIQPFLVGGLGKVAAPDLDVMFAGHRLGIGFSVTDSRFQLTGETNGADFDSELELMTAYVADPGFRASAFEKARTLAQTGLAQADATASLTAQRDLAGLLSARDRRWSTAPTAADLAASRAQDLAAILRPALAGPINLVVVGDVDVDRAIAAAQATIGALPPRGPRPSAPPEVFPAIPAQPIVVAAHGRNDDAVAVAAWPTPGFFANMADARALQVLAEIIEGRLQDGLREQDGLTYSPNVSANQSTLFESYGTLAAQVEVAPEKIPRFFATLDRIADDLARTPVSLEELNRAREPMVDQSRRQQRITTELAAELVDADEEPRVFDLIRSRVPDLVAVKPDDIQRLARKYLSGIQPYRVIFRTPAAGAR